MKKTLMLLAALVMMLFVGGNMASTASAQEVSAEANQQDTMLLESVGDRTVVAAIVADSIQRVDATDDAYELVYLNITDRPRIDTVLVARVRPSTPVVDTLAVAAEVLDSLDDTSYKSKIVKWAGRDRYGRFTDQCAAHANGCLKRAGYYSQGHAYQIPYHFPSVINGYTKVKIPDLSTVSSENRYATVLNMHREAADYVKEHLDISKLVPGKYYVVNMYYSTSPYMLQFFYSARKQGTYNYGTHVGVLYYSREHKIWIVEHNIHGHVYYDALESILGGLSNPHKYGVTSISRVSR